MNTIKKKSNASLFFIVAGTWLKTNWTRRTTRRESESPFFPSSGGNTASLSEYFYFVRLSFSLITVAFYFFVKNAHLTIRVFAQEVMEKVTFGDLANMAIKEVQD